jgi:hypothetical protein
MKYEKMHKTYMSLTNCILGYEVLGFVCLTTQMRYDRCGKYGKDKKCIKKF